MVILANGNTKLVTHGQTALGQGKWCSSEQSVANGNTRLVAQ